jgi:hypothetical protein
MTEPQQDDGARQAPRADPTLRVARPPVPGRAVRAEVAAGHRATPPIRHDEPTVALTPQAGHEPRRTLEFGAPSPVKVTVSARPRRKRRYRTWPWIVAVVLALVVLGTVLLVMLLRGETIDGDTDLIGAGRSSALAIASVAAD